MRSAVVYVIDKNGYELAWHAATSFLLTQSNFQDLHVFCHAIRKKANIERANKAITLAELMSSEPIQAS
jgi:hypothetical protein